MKPFDRDFALLRPVDQPSAIPRNTEHLTDQTPNKPITATRIALRFLPIDKSRSLSTLGILSIRLIGGLRYTSHTIDKQTFQEEEKEDVRFLEAFKPIARHSRRSTSQKDLK